MIREFGAQMMQNPEPEPKETHDEPKLGEIGFKFSVEREAKGYHTKLESSSKEIADTVIETDYRKPGTKAMSSGRMNEYKEERNRHLFLRHHRPRTLTFLWWLTRSEYNPNGCRQIPTSTGTSKH
jgi:hypothetical protein